MHVIATAGHVDHGKSTLVRVLTGMDPDRLAEEHRRGLTIDLGYAWTTAGQDTIAFVDVPGHQRFISNMLAGVGPVPAVLFVVAADEGWCAQSAEHLQALDALQVRHGVLAVTRVDLGDAAPAEAEARDHLRDTSLAGIEAVAVSPVAGTGLDELRGALARMAAGMDERPAGRTRLWIDRVFTVRGSGTVVTGTLSGGAIAAGDRLQLHPSGEIVHVRAMQSLNADVERAESVSRVALNLRGVPRARVHRGDTLTAPGEWRDVSVLDVRLSEPQRLPEQSIFHLGSAAIPTRTRPLGPDTARLTLERPVVTAVGERAILRDPGARRMIGVVVLDPQPPALSRRGAAQHRARQLAEMTGAPDPAGEVARRGSVRQDDLILNGVIESPMAVPPPGAVVAGDWLIDEAVWRGWAARLPAVVDDWAQAHPAQPGIGRPALADALDLPDPGLLDPLLAVTPGIAADADGVHRPGDRPALGEEARFALDELRERLAADPFAAPDARQLADAGLTDRMLSLAVADGQLLRVTESVYLLPDALDEAVRRLAAFEEPFTMAQARQALRTTRRVAVPLMELLDRRRRTRRVDSQRRELIRRP